MKKLIAILMPLFMLLLLLTACSSGTDSTAKEKTEEGVSSEAAHDELVDGSWEATGVMVANEQKGDIVLNLDSNGEFTEDVFFADKEGNVTDTENPTLTYKGTFKTEDDKLTLDATEKTEEGNTTEITDLANEMPVGDFTYTVDGDALTLQNTTSNEVYDFVKI